MYAYKHKAKEFNNLQMDRKNLRRENDTNNYGGMYSYLSNMYDVMTTLFMN